MKQNTKLCLLLPIKTCTLGTQSCHISSADCPIYMKFGLWLVLMIILVPCIHMKPDICTPSYQNLHSGYSKLSYLSGRWSDWTEIWFVASSHDYVGTLYSLKTGYMDSFLSKLALWALVVISQPPMVRLN